MNNLVTYRRPAAGRLNPVWDNIFNDFFDLDYNRGSSLRKPSADVNETDNSYNFEIELPGFREDELDVSVDKNVLKIKAEKSVDAGNEDNKKTEISKKLISERASAFFRSFLLPENTDIEKISAKYENGILFLSVDKKEKELPKKIRIN